MTGTQRQVLEAKRLFGTGFEGTSIESAVPLGGPARRRQALYVEFEKASTPSKRSLDAAFLLLHRTSQSEPPRQEVEVSVRSPAGPFDEADLSRGLTPRLRSSEASGRAGSSETLRIEVTHLVRDVFARGVPLHGLVVESNSSETWWVASGTGTDIGPRLELYFSDNSPTTNAVQSHDAP